MILAVKLTRRWDAISLVIGFTTSPQVYTASLHRRTRSESHIPGGPVLASGRNGHCLYALTPPQD